MIDIKTRKIVVDPNQRNASSGEWAAPKVISSPYSGAEAWNAQPSIPPSAQPSLSTRESEQYWKDQAQAERSKTPEMSDEQKKLLADLEAGRLMKLSRLELVDESQRKDPNLRV